jgi:SAM-dependent methyltransferase
LYRAGVSEEPHSAAYFGPERDFWWNADHLRLIGARRALRRVHNVLDVGSGVGHWGRLIATLVAPGAAITGVEQEAEWVAQATRSAPDERFRYVQGDAAALPFDDDTFDLVTCQTVLIHLADPQAAIREFARVAKPGGQVIVAEPNNRASFVVGSSHPPEDVLDVLAFVLACERGKIALGEGNNSIGDLVPGLLRRGRPDRHRDLDGRQAGHAGRALRLARSGGTGRDAARRRARHAVGLDARAGAALLRGRRRG